MVHRREVDGEVLVLGNQGALWQRAMTWWDHETGSVWSQPLGEAVAGPLKGTRLELLPSTLTEWGTWRRLHPDTLALYADGRPSGFSLEQTVIVVEFGGEAAAYPVRTLPDVGVVNDEVGGVAVAVFVNPDNPQQWAVLSRQLDDRVVELRAEAGLLAEAGGDARWDPVTGSPVAGTDQALDILAAFTSFEEDFLSFFPHGRVWQPPATPES